MFQSSTSLSAADGILQLDEIVATLSTISERPTRRIPFSIDGVQISSLVELEERVNVVFHRFLPADIKKLSINLPGNDADHFVLNLTKWVHIYVSDGQTLDSDDKVQRVFTKVGSQPINVRLNVVISPVDDGHKSIPIPAPRKQSMPSTATKDDTVQCDGCGEDCDVTSTTAYKCMHCYQIRLCSGCEASGQHDGHLLLPRSTLLRGAWKWNATFFLVMF